MYNTIITEEQRKYGVKRQNLEFSCECNGLYEEITQYDIKKGGAIPRGKMRSLKDIECNSRKSMQMPSLHRIQLLPLYLS